MSLDPARTLAQAQAHRAAGRLADAAALYEQVLERDPDNFDACVGLAYSRMPGERYRQVLARMHAWLRPRSYAEIGVETGASLVLAGPGTRAVGIDPGLRIEHPLPAGTKLFPLESDAFFERHDLLAEVGRPALDMAFIDGLHVFEQVLRDFMNLERCAHGDSVFFFHDALPLNEFTSTRERQSRFSSGDAWKIVPCLKKYRPDLQVVTLAAGPTGLGMVAGLDPRSTALHDNWERIVAEFVPMGFEALRRDRDSLLNVASNDWAATRGLLARWAAARAGSAAKDRFDKALEHHRGGNAAAAEALYRGLLQDEQYHADALHMLGVLAHSAGEHALAVSYIAEVVAAHPGAPEPHNNLAEAYRALGRLQEAERHRHVALAVMGRTPR